MRYIHGKYLKQNAFRPMPTLPKNTAKNAQNLLAIWHSVLNRLVLIRYTFGILLLEIVNFINHTERRI